MLRYRVLGPLEVEADGRRVQLGGPKQRATLAILLLGANRVVSIDRLGDDLYAGAPPATAVTQVQRQVSDLRKLLGATTIETVPPGYVLRVPREALDLAVFERLATAADEALARGEAARAAELLHEALALWRGAPLADLPDDPFADAARRRLEELRLGALEQRFDAEIVLGRDGTLVPELEELLAAEPFRERLWAQLMLVLYRAGRPSDALAAYRRARAAFVDGLGIEPSPALRRLEAAILAHDPALAGRQAPVAERVRCVLVAARSLEALDELRQLAAPLSGASRRELLVTLLLADGQELGAAAAALETRRAALPAARAAAFTSTDPAADVLRLARAHDVELVLLDAAGGLTDGRLGPELAATVAASPADVALLANRASRARRSGGVFVPFTGGEHDWASLELAAALAQAQGLPLALVGTGATAGRRDASRLLADASLAAQRGAGVAATPVLAAPGDDALVAAVEPATLVVVGLPAHWRENGIGAARGALVERSSAPVVLVHRGLRPGALAPRETRTRYTWSVEPP